MVDRSDSLNGHSSEGELVSENDAEYVPELQSNKLAPEPSVDSQIKLKYLMDKIDTLTNSLNKYSTQKKIEIDKHKRHKGTENEDEKTLICNDATLYTIKLTKQPKNIIGGTMRDYQLEGLNWMLKMHYCNINGILADEMGLGKTLQTISLIAQLSLQEEQMPSIIIVPKSTLSN